MAERLSTFLKIFGDTPVLRVIDFFMVHEDFDYSMTDISKFSGVGYSTLKLFWHNLESNNIVVITREIGKAKMYKLNSNNPAVKRMKDFYWTTTKIKTRQLLEKQRMKIKA